MKRITFLLLSFLMAVLSPNPVSAQNNSTLTLSVSDTPLNEILNKIEKKTSYSFQYSTQVIDVRQKRSIHVRNPADRSSIKHTSEGHGHPVSHQGKANHPECQKEGNEKGTGKVKRHRHGQ